VKSHFESSMTDMFSAALKVMRVSYDLFWIALIITAGVGALAFHHVALRLILRMWRAWRRSKQGVPHERSGRDCRHTAEGGANDAAYRGSGRNAVTAISGGQVALFRRTVSSAGSTKGNKRADHDR
jgi:hypothetical protein